MRTFSRAPLAFSSLLLSAALIGCAASQDAPRSSSTDATSPAAASARPVAPPDDTTPIAGDSTVLLVNGLSCPKCATNIHVSLKQVPGVADSTIDLETGRVTVIFDRLAKANPSPATLARVVTDSGFTLVGIE